MLALDNSLLFKVILSLNFIQEMSFELFADPVDLILSRFFEHDRLLAILELFFDHGLLVSIWL